MKLLILLPDVNEVTLFGETLSAVIQYYRTIGNIWDTLYAKHQLRDSASTWIESTSCSPSSWSNWSSTRNRTRLRRLAQVRTTPRWSPQPMMSTSTRAKVRSREVKAKVQRVKAYQEIGDSHAVIIRKQTDVALDIAAKGITLDANQDDAQSVELPSTTHHNADALRSLRWRMRSMKRGPPKNDNAEWEQSYAWVTKEYEASGEGHEVKVESVDTCLQWCLQSLNLHGDMQHGIPWITWSALLPSRRRSSLLSSLANGPWPYNARSLSTDMTPRTWSNSPCTSRTMLKHLAKTADPGELDLEPGHDKPELCFSRSQARDPAYVLLDSGASHVLLPGHMLPIAARSFEVTVNLAVGKE